MFFLSRIWLWWLLAALVALAVTWLLVHWWAGRLDREHCAPHEAQLRERRDRLAQQRELLDGAAEAAPTAVESTVSGHTTETTHTTDTTDTTDTADSLRARLDEVEDHLVPQLRSRIAELRAQLTSQEG